MLGYSYSPDCGNRHVSVIALSASQAVWKGILALWTPGRSPFLRFPVFLLMGGGHFAHFSRRLERNAKMRLLRAWARKDFLGIMGLLWKPLATSWTQGLLTIGPWHAGPIGSVRDPWG